MTRFLSLFWVLVFAWTGSSTSTVSAQLKLPAIISDHMVLQRDKSVPIWGWADPQEPVAVTFGIQSKSTIADMDGRWLVHLDSMSASAEPQSLTIRALKQGTDVEIKDVLVGEVWLGSGQSNMAMSVSSARDFQTEQSQSDFPQLRMFREESVANREAQTQGKGKWVVSSPETVGSFSATLYFFGRELHQRLEVPVGLINSSVGGTPIESWIPATAQEQSPELQAEYMKQKGAFEEFDEAAARDRFEQDLARWTEKSELAKAAGKAVPAKPINPLEARNRRGGPGYLFNGKIAPLIPYALRGIVWYQGEANTTPGNGQLYQFQLPLLVQQWRERWGEELPFAWVQLPKFKREGEGWMLVRQAMLETLRLDRTGMAITVDIGEANDIHPKNKQDVGHRLALWALGTVYSIPVDATTGPLPTRIEILGNEIAVTFSHVAEGLTVNPQNSADEEIKGFEIAGEDQMWLPATARIDGNRILVSNPMVTNPIATRYAWAANPDCNLFNKAGLPASPFRSDGLPVTKSPE
jgi:sialate O-acetylesterase